MDNDRERVMLDIDMLELSRDAALELDPSPERDVYVQDLDRALAALRRRLAQMEVASQQ